MLTKTIIWSFVLAGIFAACLFPIKTSFLERKVGPASLRSRYGADRQSDKHSVQLHDTYTLIGTKKWQVRVYPRTWATVMIIAGALAILVGLVFIFHIPHVHSA